MKVMLLATLIPLVGCTKSFRALSPEPAAVKGTPTVTVTMNNAETLPLCSGSSEGLSVFLAKEGVLYRCQNGNWFAADTQKKTWGYQTRATVRYNQWEDLSTRKRWAIAPAQDDLSQSCNQGWRLPLRKELVKASENGLFEGIKANGGTAFGRAWTRENVNGKEERIAIRVSASAKEDEHAGVYCVLDT